jgi:hypothetical protein
MKWWLVAFVLIAFVFVLSLQAADAKGAPLTVSDVWSNYAAAATASALLAFAMAAAFSEVWRCTTKPLS